MWSLNSPQCTPQRFGKFQPVEVLYEFDVPMIFTFTGEDGLFLAYLCADDNDTQIARYLTVAANKKLIDELKTGSKTVFEALNQPWLWVVDVSYEGVINAAWQIDDLAQIPEAAKPTKDAMLWPELMPFFSYRLIGDGLEKGRVPASVVARAIDGTTAAIKRLMLVASSTSVSQGRPEKWLKQLCDLPTQNFAYNSFEVAFRSGFDSNQADFVGLDIDPYSEGVNQLTIALNWLLKDDSHSLQIGLLEVLSNLVPPKSGVIQEVEIKGKLLNGKIIKLRREHTEKVRNAISLAKKDIKLVATEGYIGELDKDKFSFILRQRPDNQPDLNCFSEQDAIYDDVLSAFAKSLKVKVVGYLTTNRSSALEVSIIDIVEEFL